MKNSLPSGDFPLQSITFFATSPYHLSLMQTYLLITLIKTIGFLAAAYFIVLISVIARKAVITLFISLSVILIPYYIYFNDSVKYKLPIPLGFMIGNGYFRGNGSGNYQSSQVLSFIGVSKSLLSFEFAGIIAALVILAVLSILLFSRLYHFEFKNTSFKWGKNYETS